LIALAFWTWLWGPMGGFLTSPILIVGPYPQRALDACRCAAIAAGLIRLRNRPFGGRLRHLAR
jgi:hypothetical protein